MPTTNLISKSLGNILVQSGNGAPDHVADKGSYYTNIDTGTLFINIDGTATGWGPLSKIAYAQMTVTDNATEIAPGSLNQWQSTTSLTWVEKENNGLTFSSGTLKPRTGKSGTFLIILAGCIKLDPSFGSTYGYDIGVSKTGAGPTKDLIGSAQVGPGVDLASIGVIGYITLTTSDTISVAMRNTTSTTPNQLLYQASLIMYRVGD